MHYTLGASLVGVGVLACGFALAIPGESSGPRIAPVLAALALCASGLAVLQSKAIGVIPQDRHAEQRGVFGALALVSVGAAYIVAIDQLGFLLATLMAAAWVHWLFGERRFIRLAVLAIVTPVVLHVVFFRLLGVFPPLGIRFDLMDYLPI